MDQSGRGPPRPCLPALAGGLARAGLADDRLSGRRHARALLAVSSYPFPWQGRLLSGMGALVLLMVLTITVIVFGVNRDEVISRVANTTPHRIKLDQPLMTSVFTYIVPLLGALAVLSFDLSDILRTWLDPILR